MDIIALTQVLARIVRPVLVSTLLVALVFCLSPAGVTRAATVTLVVDTTVDSNGSAYRACTGAANDCSLRGAITRANAGSGDDYVIVLPAGTYALTLAGVKEDGNATGDLDISSANTITIDGAGEDVTIIDGNDLDRVLEIQGGIVEINDVTIAHGHAPDGPLNSSDGGGIYSHFGTLTMNRCTLRDNQAGDDSPSHVGGDGGGMYVTSSQVTMNRCTIRDNRAGDGPAGRFGGHGGGMYNAGGNVTLIFGTISGNRAGHGGENSGGDGGRGGWGGGIGTQGAMTINCCTISGNDAGDGGAGSVDGGSGGNGGGLYVAGGSVMVTGSTFSGNAGGTGGDGGSGTTGYGGYGGGIESNKGTTVIIDSTVTGNHGGEGGAGTPAGNNGNGGGVDNSNDGTLTLINCTISGNHTGSSWGYGGGANNFGALTFKHTIIANNTASSMGPDCIGLTSLHSDGYNLVENTANCPIDSNANNVYGQDPLLGTLGDYGGPTLTFEPQPGSPVIDAGNPAGCTHHEGGPLPVDQRGFPRHVDGGSGSATCDIGAVELQPRYLLTVNVGGAGTVTSDWDDIDCGNDCTGWYGDSAIVTLTATPSGDWSTFIGWGGACSGTGSCVVVMDQARTVTAAFVADNQVYLPVIRRE